MGAPAASKTSSDKNDLDEPKSSKNDSDEHTSSKSDSDEHKSSKNDYYQCSDYANKCEKILQKAI